MALRQKKFYKGREIRSLAILSVWLKEKGWCYYGRSVRPKHPSIIVNMTFRTLMLATEKGFLWKAERTNQEPKDAPPKT